MSVAFSVLVAAAAAAPQDRVRAEAGHILPAAHLLRFDGRDSVELKDSTNLVALDGSFTVELWVRWSPYHADGMDLAGDAAWPGMSADLPAATECGWVLRTSPLEDGDCRRIDFTIAVDSKGKTTWQSLVSRPRRCIDPAGWHHLAISKSRDAVSLFWNGSLVGREALHGTPVACGTPLYLGVRKSAAANRTFFGDVRALRLSDRARYTKDFTPPEHLEKDEATVTLLDFAQVKDDHVRDASGKHHGTIAGATLIKPPD